MGDHRWWISDIGEFTRDYPGFRDRARRRSRAARHLRRRTPSGGSSPPEPVGRHPGLQRGRVDRRHGRGAVAGALRAEGVDYEVIVVDDASTDGTAEAVAGRARPTTACPLRPVPPPARVRLRGPLGARPCSRRTRSRS